MNTIRSTWYGWGVLIVAGGGSYYFAKRSVNADRQTRYEEEMRRQRMRTSIETETHSKPPPVERKKHKTLDPAASPSTEASHDPAPTEHGIDGEKLRKEIADKYLPTKPYRSKKGDRFS